MKLVLVFIESWIINNSGEDFILKQCCPQSFFSIVHLMFIKEVEYASCTDMTSIKKILEDLPLIFVN